MTIQPSVCIAIEGNGNRPSHRGDVASTRNVFDIGETRTQECVVHKPTKLCLDMMGGKIGAHHTDDDTAPTLTHGRGSANDVHAVVSTNSNGGDVMPTLTNDLVKQTGNQQAAGGGILSMNFEMYDKAENVNVNLCANRAADCMVIEKKEAK